MNDLDLVPLLGAMESRALQALIDTLDDVPRVVPTLHAWLAHAVHWERDRRRGLHYPLRSPIVAIAVDDLQHAVLATQLLAAMFRHEERDDARPVRAFFEAVAQMLALERVRARPMLH